MPETQPRQTRTIAGLPQALGAYAVWSLFPLYFALLHEVAAFEVVVWRLLFTLPFCLAMVLLFRQGAALKAALTTPRILGALALSGLLIGANWLIYVIAVMDGHVLAASLGYYINPLVNVLAATVFLPSAWRCWHRARWRRCGSASSWRSASRATASCASWRRWTRCPG